MLIVCPNCATSYDVDAASLRPDGRKVRCARCRTVWHAELPHTEQLIAAAEALAPVRRAVEAVAEATAEEAASAAEPPVEQFEAAMSAAAGPPAEEPALNAPMDSPPSDAGESMDVAAAIDVSSVEVESPPIVPADAAADHPPIEVEPAPPTAASAELPEDIETIAARRYPRHAKRKRWQWPLSQLQSGILALIVANAIVIGWRGDFVRAMPQTASFYAWLGLPVNVRGLDFENLDTATERHDDVPILVIGGDIVNITGNAVTVPRLRFAVRNAARQEIYSWTAVPPRSMLPPGQGVEFHTRLASPPPDAHDVVVRFLNRNDILAGAR